MQGDCLVHGLECFVGGFFRVSIMLGLLYLGTFFSYGSILLQHISLFISYVAKLFK